MVRSSRWLALGAVVSLLATLLITDAGADGKAGGIAWIKDYAQARKKASEEGKWMFVDFYTDT